MKIRQFHIYLANLDPAFGTEPGKIRPVVVIQSDLLNESHFSTLVCPLTTAVCKKAAILRISLSRKESGLKQDLDILVDQVRAIDNRRFIKRIGRLTESHQQKLTENLKIVLFE